MKVYCFQNFHIIDLFIHLYFFHLKIPFAFSDLLQYTFLRSQINYEDLLFSVFNVSIMFFFSFTVFIQLEPLSASMLPIFPFHTDS